MDDYCNKNQLFENVIQCFTAQLSLIAQYRFNDFFSVFFSFLKISQQSIIPLTVSYRVPGGRVEELHEVGDHLGSHLLPARLSIYWFEIMKSVKDSPFSLEFEYFWGISRTIWPTTNTGILLSWNKCRKTRCIEYYSIHRSYCNPSLWFSCWNEDISNSVQFPEENSILPPISSHLFSAPPYSILVSHRNS